MNHPYQSLYIILSLTIVVMASGCQGINSATPTDDPPFTPSSSPLPSHTVTSTKYPTITSTPTTTFTSIPTITSLPLPSLTSSQDNNTPALRFVFPTPGPAPISAWRPPLYDVPWAITPFDHFYFARPIAADEVNWPLADYRYGAQWPEPGKEDVVHTGIDIDAPAGTPVLAAAPGKVVWVGFGLEGQEPNPADPYGLAILIMHDFGYEGEHLETVYAHLSEADVIYGQEVTTGEKIGLVGDTGASTGPHLHFEVRVENPDGFYTTRNPELWLVPPQGWGVLVGRIMKDNWTPLFLQEINVNSIANGDTWLIKTYKDSPAIHSDDYYDENMVLSDLPAGDYEVSLKYNDIVYEQVVSIHPGMVTYLSFTVSTKFSTQLPPTSTINFLSTATPIPKH